MAFSDDYDDDSPEGKRAAHTARLETLRLFVEGIATAVQDIDLPDTYLEAERATRCLFVNDRALEDMPQKAGPDLHAEAVTATQPIRRLIRRRADQLMESAARIPLPTCFLEGERAGRYALGCKRLLDQIYQEPKASAKTPKLPAFAPDFADDEDDIPETEVDYVRMLTDKLNHLSSAKAQAFGFWGTGEPFDPAHPRAGCTDGERPPVQPKRLLIDDDALADLTAVSAPAVHKALTDATAPEHPLDRPVWSALTSTLSPLVTPAGTALRLRSEYSDFAAAAHYDAATLTALSQGDAVRLIEPPDIAANIPETLITERRQWRQMILDRLPPLDFSRKPRFVARQHRPLGPADRREMQGLAKKCGLPPLPPDVHVFGDWLGTRIDGKLVCMSGTRLFLPGYTEIFGLCTHPDYRCDGLAERNLRVVARTILERGDTPFLHVDVDDAAARAYSHKMGFIDRKTLEVLCLKPPLPSGGERAGVRGLPMVEPPLTRPSGTLSPHAGRGDITRL